MNQLLNTVRLARDNAERADNRVDHSFYYALTIALEELQERRQADSEPAMYVMGMGQALDAETASTCKGAVDSWVAEWNQSRLPGQADYKTVPLYRHAQPAPVAQEELERMRSIVSDPRALPRRKEWISGQQYSYVLLEEVEAIVEDACRAAMLQAEPVTTANKLENYPAQSPIDHGYRPGCECSGCKTIVRICAELAGWIPVSEQLPEEGGRYWCYVEEQNSLGKSHYQWNCSWNGEIWGGAMMYGRVTHWMPLPNPPKEEK
nr:DUF551 domain-containing protein [Klebsiella aerogenes]